MFELYFSLIIFKHDQKFYIETQQILVMHDYFKETKKKLQKKIPDFDTKDFESMRKKISNELKKNESEQKILLRSLKILLLGDWYTEEKKEILFEIKNNILDNGYYAETIDSYCDIKAKDGLSPVDILERCCINHQLIVFIDGSGKGTLTEQNYLASNYPLHKKVVFFIKEDKFNEFKTDASCYIRDFPSIVIYRDDTDLMDKSLIFSKFRLHRLAKIISEQKKNKRGLHGGNYTPWYKRLRR